MPPCHTNSTAHITHTAANDAIPPTNVHRRSPTKLAIELPGSVRRDRRVKTARDGGVEWPGHRETGTPGDRDYRRFSEMVILATITQGDGTHVASVEQASTAGGCNALGRADQINVCVAVWQSDDPTTRADKNFSVVVMR